MIRIVLIACLCLLVTSCAHFTSPSVTAPTKQTWQGEKPALTAIQNWQMSGKIAVITQKNAGSADFSWVEQHQHYLINLSGPFGAGALKLTGRPNKVTVTNANGQTMTANNPEELLHQTWGFYVPVSNLRYWVRGIPVPNLPYQTQFDAQNRLVLLTQSNWRIQFLGYTRIGRLDLPNKIFITSPLLKVKMIIYQWRLA